MTAHARVQNPAFANFLWRLGIFCHARAQKRKADLLHCGWTTSTDGQAHSVHLGKVVATATSQEDSLKGHSEPEWSAAPVAQMRHIRVSFIRLLISFSSPVRSECLCGFKKQSDLTKFVLKPDLQEKYCPPLYGKNLFEVGPPSPPPTRVRYAARYNLNITFCLQETKTQFTLYCRERATHLACLTGPAMSPACSSGLKATDAPGSQITP